MHFQIAFKEMKDTISLKLLKYIVMISAISTQYKYR